MVLLCTHGCIQGMQRCGMHGLWAVNISPARTKQSSIKGLQRIDVYLKTAALFASTKSSRSRTKGRGSVGAFNHFSMPSLAARHSHSRELIATCKLLFLQHRLAFVHAAISIKSVVCSCQRRLLNILIVGSAPRLAGLQSRCETNAIW